MPAASLLRKGFQTRYSVLVAGGGAVSPFSAVVWLTESELSTDMRFSP